MLAFESAGFIRMSDLRVDCVFMQNFVVFESTSQFSLLLAKIRIGHYTLYDNRIVVDLALEGQTLKE